MNSIKMDERIRETQSSLYEGLNYTIDKSCYPWVAYKGPRFNPTDMFLIMTDKESKLYNLLSIYHPSHPQPEICEACKALMPMPQRLA